MIITHGQYVTNGEYIRNTDKRLPLPLKFRHLLYNKAQKWSSWATKPYPIIDFTVACDPDLDIWAIAIVHPKDNFSRKLGVKIVKGRMERLLRGKGYDLKAKNSSGRGLKYPYIYKLER